MIEPNHYTAKDVERYHSGQMTAAERHRLEKAALDDPAFADMLEGFAYTNTPSADLEALQQRLHQRVTQKQERRSVILPLQWLKVAAVFLLVATGGWLAYQSFQGTPIQLQQARKVPPQRRAPMHQHFKPTR